MLSSSTRSPAVGRRELFLVHPLLVCVAGACIALVTIMLAAADRGGGGDAVEFAVIAAAGAAGWMAAWSP